MARNRTQFICQNCSTVYSRWAGKCDSCGEWNSLVEEGTNSGIGSGPTQNIRQGRIITLTSLSGDLEDAPRIHSGISELDRVTGGGFVRGSALLVGGDPGIGKSTLLTQTAAALSRKGYNVIYVSGEEAVAQIRLRAQRLGAHDTTVKLAAETNVEDILTTLNAHKKLDLVIIDSIQTLWSDAADSAPGSVTQVRISAQAIIRFAKKTGAAVVLVGHVTKDGQIAGPRVVEHMVDGVLYFEGENSHCYRILRTVKNRFGPTDEIGVFEMSDKGLKEVTNPSELFLGERNEKAPGAAVFAGMEGTRPILVEIQALVAPSSLGTPRRAVLGWDGNRLSMILAVLEAHCGIRFGQHDVYLNVAGGYKISEPAADLAVAAALVSSLVNIPLPTHYVYFGEVSLSGTIRAVTHSGQRVKEAQKLGFQGAVQPAITTEMIKSTTFQQKIFSDLSEFVATIVASKK
ncbi:MULTISPECIES: DNA repair protein RadA [Bartonella]|uniref:DNA repair protein RadA n=2 Tax=Bartonella schoenbuchensis TaxID=165694 RepID=E6YYE4_BARSR|nr:MULTISPECIES: DNA repair protein RadA [Bartonella]AQX30424.1 DNA replication and repair protein RadA [Bartonella schoenbuchensis R1]CBI81955.1 DNA repair protein [Bartonella schoenbuchensis R1]CDP79903.1 DNA repair protein RadA [Bartonella schoenbuchensis]